MTKVIADITMSIDGFVTGPDPDLEHGLGHGGEPLHAWVFSDDEVDAQVLEDSTERSGAVVMGRRLFDIIDGPHGWNDEMGYGARHAGTPPFFVVTHSKPESIRLALDFTFVTDGLASAIQLAGPRPGPRMSSSWAVATWSANASTTASPTSWCFTSRRSSSAPVPHCSPAQPVVSFVSVRSASRRIATHLTYDVVA